jgi:hypothetical protein
LRLIACGESAACSAARRAGFLAVFSRERALPLSMRFEVREEMYSVRRRKETLASATFFFPRAAIGRRRALSRGWRGAGCEDAWIAKGDCQLVYILPVLSQHARINNVHRSSPSNTPGMPTKSRGMPSSASASMLRGCSLANLDAKPGLVYCPLARPVFGMSRSFGGFGGGGRALEKRMRAMKS